jgi:hypothetical protein
MSGAGPFALTLGTTPAGGRTGPNRAVTPAGGTGPASGRAAEKVPGGVANFPGAILAD